jgi:hypothetical protein
MSLFPPHKSGAFSMMARFSRKSQERKQVEPELKRDVDGLSHSKPGSVDQQSEGSFPASDAPSFSSSVIGAPWDRRTSHPSMIAEDSGKKAKGRAALKPRPA